MRSNLSRRGFLRAGTASAAALLGGSALLSACTADDTTNPGGQDDGDQAPQSGGTLRAAFVGGGAAETLNFLMGPTALDYVRARTMHGALGTIDPNEPDGVRYGVLERIEISDDLSEYTLRLRPDVRFTDGSTLTAEDVIYSLQAPATLGALPFLLPPSQNFDLDSARVADDLTVVLPAVAPIADGRLILCQSILVFKDGTAEFTPDMPTCGPFQLTDFEPGQGAVFARFDDYYGLELGDGPYLDGLELRSIPDNTARMNALTGGQVDFAHDLGPVAARTLEGTDGYEARNAELPYANALTFAMNLNFEPFQDVRVRQAFKHAIDRQAIVDSVLYGYGFVGNDLNSLGFPDYPEGIPQREYDPELARELLADAGAEGVRVELTTAPEIAGMAETATLIVEQLREIGVDATLDERPAGQLFADPAEFFALPFANAYSPPVPPLANYATARAGGSPSAFGFDRPDIDELVTTARGSADPAAREEAAQQAYQLLWDEGNSIVPVFIPAVNGEAAAVHGVRNEPFPYFDGAYLAT